MYNFFKRAARLLIPPFLLPFVARIIFGVADFLYPGGRKASRILSRNQPERLGLFQKKRPTSECFPYRVFTSVDVQNPPVGYDAFYFVGDNWVRDTELPIAFCFGFNDWKMGFSAAYLPGYRTIFAPRKTSQRRARKIIRRAKTKPAAIVVWGYTDARFKGKSLIERLARMSKIPFIRMEDGFIRSAPLGAAHSTPYSLVMDKTGLHISTSKPSDLTMLLNRYDYAGDPELLEEAAKLRGEIVERGLSKYNPPSLVRNADTFALKRRKRVLVIGQVERDAAVKMANPSRWSMRQMVVLARLENIDAEIIYKPHPDVYAGFQKSRFRDRQVLNIARVLPPDVSMMDALIDVDHVYTLTSLAGLEALLRGIKVTVLGRAFYGGWGLTDDRTTYTQRKRKLTLDELFAGIYLQYATYLADLDDPVSGLKTTIMRIEADKRLGTLERVPEVHELPQVAHGPRWPVLVLNPNMSREPYAEAARASFVLTPVIEFLREIEDEFAILVVATSVAGWLESESDRNAFLFHLREHLSLEGLNTILLELHEFKPGNYLVQHFSWLLEQARADGSSSIYIRDRFRSVLHERDLPQSATKGAALLSKALDTQLGDADDEAPDAARDEDREKEIRAIKIDLLNNLFASQLLETDYDGAAATGLKLLAAGQTELTTVMSLAEIARKKFNSKGAHEIARFVLESGHGPMRGKAATMVFDTTSPKDVEAVIENASLYSVAMPNKAVNVEMFLGKMTHIPEIVDASQRIGQFLDMDNTTSIEKAQAFMAFDRSDRALEILEALDDEDASPTRVAVTMSQALSYLGRVEESEEIIRRTLDAFPTSLVYREALRICVLTANYDRALVLLKQARARRIPLGDMAPRKAYFGARMPFEAVETFRDLATRNRLKRHYQTKFCEVPNYQHPDGEFLALPIFGPGDELRFASIYNALPKVLPHRSLKVGVEPRMQPLFARSFPKLDFVPVKRLRMSDPFDLDDYNRLASSELRGVLDNNAVDAIEACDEFALVTDLLAEVLTGYDAFEGKAYLKASPAKVKAFRKRLPDGVPLVGLSWRSSLTTHSRNEHYLTIEELAPLLALPNIQFVNMQYDECSEELAWAEERFPGKIIDLEDVDHYNDFDSVSALMGAVDLIVAPATTVVELAGALGRPTLMMSNSSELHWRVIDEAGTDVWHNSIQHVEGAVLGNKESLVEALRTALLARFSKSSVDNDQDRSSLHKTH